MRRHDVRSRKDGCAEKIMSLNKEADSPIENNQEGRPLFYV